jgi:hypothetical protein
MWRYLVSRLAEAEAKAKEADGRKDYKGDSKFATHLKTSGGVSSFARTRTLKEQREYLPAFACREDLMKILRDNQGSSLSCLFCETWALTLEVSRYRGWRDWIG